MSEHKILSGSKNLIVCFGGMLLKMDLILPFEFLTYLSKIYKNECDLYFFVDKHQRWYHKGLLGISKNIDETVRYLNNIIKKGNYQKVIFMGVSAGGYAAILFGSLCNVTNVVSFKPRTRPSPNGIGLRYQNKFRVIDKRYGDLKNIINNTTSYILYGDTSIENINDNHHILQCDNLSSFSNVEIIKLPRVDLKQLIKIIDQI